MPKLTQLRGTLAPLKSRIGWLNEDAGQASRARDAVNPDRGWYKTADWQRLRWRVLVRDLFTCAFCGKVEGVTRNLVADHKVPHRFNAALFWDDENLQTLCKPCHDSTKQRIERGGAKSPPPPSP